MDKIKTMNIKKVIVIIAVICIPIMYSFFYLKSYWDPYGKLDNMTVAMVNLDTGDDGQNLGKEFIDGLIEKDVINIKEVTKEEAEKGLIEEDYFAIITIPSTFTKYLNSASSENKQIATITYSPNQKYNYLASQIINKVVTAAETELQSQVAEKVVETLSDNLKEIPESLGEIDDGVDQLLDGSNKLRDGLGELNNGVGTLNSKYSEFDQGVDSAFTGSQTLTNGIGQVTSGVSALDDGAVKLDTAMTQINNGANTLVASAGTGISTLTNGMSELSTGSNSLAAGMAQIAGKTPELVAGTNDLSVGASQLSTGITQYVDTVNLSMLNIVSSLTTAVQADPTLASNPYIAGLLSTDISSLSSSGEILKNKSCQLASGAASVNEGAVAVNSAIVDQLNPGVQALNEGTTKLASAETTSSLNQLVAGVGTLQNALGEVKKGTENLKSGVNTLSSGTNQLQTGSQTLSSGLSTLSSSSKQVKDALVTLKDGTQSAYNGSTELRNGIQELKNGVTDGIDEANKEIVKLDGLGEFVKDSVKIEEVDYGEIDAYGTAFTPLFVSVGLWVGALMAYVVLYYDQDKRFKLLGKFADKKIVQCGMYLVIAIIQGIVTGFLLDLGLDLSITSYGLYYGSCILIAITFMSIVQFLIVNFGEVGKFLGLLILVLQLASSGGTFPVALIDEGFQVISPYLPMTYTIQLTKEAIISQREGVAGKNIAIMMAYTVVCLLITLIVQIIKKKKKLNDELNER